MDINFAPISSIIGSPKQLRSHSLMASESQVTLNLWDRQCPTFLFIHFIMLYLKSIQSYQLHSDR